MRSPNDAERLRGIFGAKKESWMRMFVKKLVGEDTIERKKLVKEISMCFDMSPRTAYRKIVEFLEIDEIYQNKGSNTLISVNPFVKVK